MLNRIAAFVSKLLDVRLWIAVAVAAVVLFGLMFGLFHAAETPAGQVWLKPGAALLFAWTIFTFGYFLVRGLRYAARQYRAFRVASDPVRMRRGLGWIVGTHLPLLLALLYWPLGLPTARSLFSEVFEFDFRVFPAVFLLAWALLCVLVVMHCRKPAGTWAGRVYALTTLGLGAVFVAFAFAAHVLAPASRMAYRAFGADLPGPTLALYGIHDYALALPAIGIALAAYVAFAPVEPDRRRRIAFEGLIGMGVLANVLLVLGLWAAFLPFFGGCGGPEWDEGFTRLHAAASLGRVDSIPRRIAQGDPVNGRDLHGLTPLHIAIRRRDADVAQALLDHGADVNAGDGDDENGTPLHSALGRGRTDFAGFLLARGARVNATTDKGVTPLHLAASGGFTEAAAFLLARGAQIDALSEVGETPLHAALTRGEVATAELLLAHGADINAKSKDGTPLDVALGYAEKGYGERGSRERVALFAHQLADRGAVRATPEEIESAQRTAMQKKQARLARGLSDPRHSCTV